MTGQQPGAIRPVPDPQAEVERLVEARNDPPGREWAVRHPDGSATDQGSSRAAAVRLRDNYNTGCSHCGPEPRVICGHTLAYRDTPLWRDE